MRPGRLRIVAGSLKGRRIAVPRGSDVRPTSDRVREALFSILGSVVEGAVVLDAYAGSGALGFEALSRGAVRVVFIESEVRVAGTLRRNAETLAVEPRCTFLLGSVHEVLARGAAPGPFDLVLADPPYAAGQAAGFLPLAERRLAPGGLVVLERDSRTQPPPTEGTVLERCRTARYGATSLDLYRRRSPAEGGI